MMGGKVDQTSKHRSEQTVRAHPSTTGSQLAVSANFDRIVLGRTGFQVAGFPIKYTTSALVGFGLTWSGGFPWGMAQK